MSPLLLILALAGPDEPNRLPVIQPAPHFVLIDQDEKPVKLSQFKGKAVLVSFFFTTCSGTCPATTHRMARIRQEVDAKQSLKDKVQFLSISLDPARDTPEKLRGYRRLYEIEGANWTFVTGPEKPVQTVLSAWGMWAKPAPNGQLDHPSRVYLVDGQGQIREIYNLDFLRLPWVMEDLELVAGQARR